ncbi:MAG TPA: hypothetical protein VF765_20030 [Polyangiaceae bacterium]
MPFLAACGGAVTSPGGSPPEADAGGGGVHPLTCTKLVVGGPVQQVSQAPPPNVILTSVATGPNGVLVGMYGVERDPPGTLLVRDVGFDGAPVGEQGIPGLAWEGRLDEGFGHAGVAGGTPCSFRALDASGAPPTGASVPITSYGCSLVRATSSGFSIVTTGDPAGPSLVATDAAGKTLASVALSTGGVPTAWTALPDGSLFLASVSPALDNCLCPTQFYVQHYDAAGHSLAPQQQGGITWPSTSIGVAAMGAGKVLVASTPVRGAQLGVQAFDADGDAIGPVNAIVAADAGGPIGARNVDLAAIDENVAIAAWVETTGTNESHVVGQALSSTGAPLSPPVTVATALGLHLHVVATPTGALVVWDQQGGAPVSAAPLRCAD